MELGKKPRRVEPGCRGLCGVEGPTRHAIAVPSNNVLGAAAQAVLRYGSIAAPLHGQVQLSSVESLNLVRI